ncbi:MAG: hypothetical protein ACTSR8_01835 [Promethearchaeota archaeon]
MGDTNQNGKIEIIAFTKTGRLYIIDLEGKILFEDSISKNESIWCAQVYEGRLIIGGLDGLLRVFRCTEDYELKADWAQQFGSSISGFILEDVNGNGNTELVVYSLDKTLRVLNLENGSYVWGQVFEQGIGDAIIETEVEDPNKKIVYACGNDGTIRAFDGKKGTMLWFKRFSDKIRCINYMETGKDIIILCGGDDKQLHYIRKSTHEEIKTTEFGDYVWKCKKFKDINQSLLLVSTYSFDYLYDDVPVEEIKFTSKLECYNQELLLKWVLHEKNIETLQDFSFNNIKYVAAGTTIGELLILEGANGNIAIKQTYSSCINSIIFNTDCNMLCLCNDAGEIHALLIEND